MDGSPRTVLRQPRQGLIHSHQGFDRGLEVLRVGGCAIVEDNEIDFELFEFPVSMGAQKLTHQCKVIVLLDPDKHEGQIAGNAVSPKSRNLSRAALQKIRRRTQRAVRIKYMDTGNSNSSKSISLSSTIAH